MASQRAKQAPPAAAGRLLFEFAAASLAAFEMPGNEAFNLNELTWRGGVAAIVNVGGTVDSSEGGIELTQRQDCKAEALVGFSSTSGG